MSDLLEAASAALGVPAPLISRAAAARAAETGASVDEVLSAWAGGETVPAGAPAAAPAEAPDAEPEAYAMLRSTAMNQGRKIAEVAEALLRASALLKGDGS